MDAGGRASLEVAEQETDRLIRLVNQLLDWTRWQSGRLTIDRRSVDLAEIARRAVVLNEGRVRHRNISLQAEIPQELPCVSGDTDRLERVLLNLLDNAVKFTPGGGQITLEVRRSEGEIEVVVQDTGRGMSDEERARAFEPYYHGQGGGTGLGLAITRAIVEAHGGRIAIHSALSEGTRVWFALPL
jgi:NtrC-family two-component system sensor histidine kinase KinB